MSYINLMFPSGEYSLKHPLLAKIIKQEGMNAVEFVLGKRPRIIFENIIIPIRSNKLIELLEESYPLNYFITERPPEYKKNMLEKAQDTLEELKRIRLPELD